MRFAKKTLLLAAALLTGFQQNGLAQVQRLGESTSDGRRATASHPAETPASPTTEPFFLNARSFVIPFTVDAAGATPREVQLFSSRGPTLPWQRVAAMPAMTDAKEFQFEGHADGEYWFATRTIDSVGRAHPEGPITPQLKVFVDTVQPKVDLEVDADASGQVEVTYQISDDSPLTAELRYLTDSHRQWQSISLPATRGKHRFTPDDSWQQLSLQLVATDAAKNRSGVSKLVSRPRLAASSRAKLAATGRGQETEIRQTPFRLDSLKSPHPPTPETTTPEMATAETTIPETNAAAAPDMRVAQNPLAQNQLAPGRGSIASAPQPFRQLAPHGYAINPPGTASSSLGNFRGATTGFDQRAGTAPFRSHPLPQRQLTLPNAPNALNGPNAPYGPNGPAAGHRNWPSAARQPTGPTLPPPATPAQIGSYAPPTIYRPAATLPQELLPATEGEPDVNAVIDLNSPQQASSQPSLPTPETPPAGTSSTTTPRARTPEEAMRPLSPDRPIGKPGIPAGPSVLQRAETIPTPTAEPDPDPPRKPEPARQTARKPIDLDILTDRVPVRYSDSVRFSLEFEVEAVGNAGVDSIELYGSTDGGQTWKFWGEDPDRMSPFDIETKEEGVFGFRIVVVGRNGLTSPRPQPGETPDIVVVVDQVNPTVRISAAQYGEGDRVGSLVIRYECDDANLMPRPISLAFSDALEGPWTTIAAGLRNDGSYVWPADPGLPRQLYLRIDARDEAGNVGTYILDRPINAQGLAPRARIRGFQPLQ